MLRHAKSQGTRGRAGVPKQEWGQRKARSHRTILQTPWLLAGAGREADPEQWSPAWHGRAGWLVAEARTAMSGCSYWLPGQNDQEQDPGEQLQQAAHCKGKSNRWDHPTAPATGTGSWRAWQDWSETKPPDNLFQTLIKTISSLVSRTVCCVSFTAPSALQTQEQLVFAEIGSLC